MSCIEYPLCKYAHYENGALVCINGAPCSFQRYCSTLLKVIHTSAYKTCKEAKELSNSKKKTYASTSVNNKDINKADSEVVKEDKKNIIEKSEICDVIYVDNLIYINFKGFGLVLPNTDHHTEPKLKVFYYGEVGSVDFKFRV